MAVHCATRAHTWPWRTGPGSALGTFDYYYSLLRHKAATSNIYNAIYSTKHKSTHTIKHIGLIQY